MRQIKIFMMSAITMIALLAIVSSLAFAQNSSSDSPIPQTQTGKIPLYQSCIDSDGKDIFNYGYITEAATNWGMTLDTCVNSTTVEERVCVDGRGANMYKTCQNGCDNGACVKKTISSCSMPACAGAHATGQYYPDGCPKFECSVSDKVKLDQNFSLKPQASVTLQNYKDMKIKSLGKVQVACIMGYVCDGENCMPPKCDDKVVSLEFSIAYKSQVSTSTIVYLGVGEEREVLGVFVNLHELDEDGVATLSVRRKGNESDPNPTNTTIPKPKVKLFDGASWQCFNQDWSTGTKSETCQTEEYWKKLAANSCNDACNPVLGACGVSSFTIGSICKKDVKPPVKICDSGCNKDSKCYPIGYRQDGEFCSPYDVFKTQMGSDSKCDNNFECSSNICASNKCVSSSLFERFIAWFNKLSSKN